MKKTLFLCLVALPWMIVASAQQASTTNLRQDSSILTIDEIRFEATAFQIDTETGTATAELTLTNLQDKPRELKINVYGTQLVDGARQAHYFSTITMGRVLMRFSDKQNYLHYFLQPETAVKLTITADDFPAASSIEVVKIVFQDGAEEGRFLDAYLTAPTAIKE